MNYLDFEDHMDKLQYSFAHNTMLESLDHTLPTLKPRDTSQDTTMNVLTDNLASLEISMPAAHHGTWLSKQWNQTKQEDPVITIDSSDEQDCPVLDQDFNIQDQDVPADDNPIQGGIGDYNKPFLPDGEC